MRHGPSLVETDLANHFIIFIYSRINNYRHLAGFSLELTPVITPWNTLIVSDANRVVHAWEPDCHVLLSMGHLWIQVQSRHNDSTRSTLIVGSKMIETFIRN